MKTVLRTLLVWLLLLALPYQGMASASMLAHAGRAAATAPALEMPPCHQGMAMPAAASHHDGHADDAGGVAHAKDKAGGCASCCAGVAPLPALPLPAAPLLPGSNPIPFRAGHMPSVDPVLPERPPSPVLA